VSSGARLLANFAAEEGDGWRDHQASLQSVAQLWGLLFGPGSRVLGDSSPIPWPAGLGERPTAPAFPWLEDEGRVACWLETEDARRDPRCAGLAFGGPAPDSVFRTHDKAFTQRRAGEGGFLPNCLRGLIRVLDASELADEVAAIRILEHELESWPDWARARFTLKPRFGSSGRGRVAGTGGDADTPAVRGALSRLASRGGAILEPWLDRSVDLSAQLRVEPDGGTLLLGTLQQLVSPSGVYRGHRGWVDSRGRLFSGSDHDEPLREAAAALANAASAEGYIGPASLDAFAFRLNDGTEGPEAEREIFRPAVEFNARFTLGTVATGLIRRALGTLKAPLGLQPGNRRAFVFALAAPPGGWLAAASRVGPVSHFVPLWCQDDPPVQAQPALLFAETDRELDSVAAALTERSGSRDGLHR
jgi:hypothetical protein